MNDNLDAELQRLDEWIGGLMSALDPPQRLRAAGRIAKMVRAKQARNIAAQREPDGSPFAPRAKKREQAMPVIRPIKFLYPSGGSGKPRRAFMRSWRKQGSLFIGYDQDAGGMRSFDRKKIIKFLPLEPSEQSGGSPRTRPSIRQKQMFRHLRTYRHLKARATADEASVGFEGMAAAIASVHQGGKFDSPAPGQPRVRYPRRQLIGFSSEIEVGILDIMQAMIDEAST